MEAQGISNNKRDDDIVYSPNKYRETEGIKVRCPQKANTIQQTGFRKRIPAPYERRLHQLLRISEFETEPESFGNCLGLCL